MAYLVAISVAIALLVGFVVATQYEARGGIRYAASCRDALDVFSGRIVFITEHVDLAAFARDEIRNAAQRFGHTVAHVSLQAVRSVERLLTRLVRHLRTRRENAPAPHENAREFVKTLSDFKDTLNATHPDIDAPEVE